MIMKVGIVIGSKHRGGAERQVFLLAQGLINKGIDVTVFIMYRPTCFKPKIPFGNIPCIYLWNTRYTENMSLKYFSYLLKRLNISILHMFILGSIEFGVRAAQSAGIKNTIGSVRSIEFVDDAEEDLQVVRIIDPGVGTTAAAQEIEIFID